ncbi:L-lactate dehydrogenase (Cytochrome) [Puccinia sorghi]|uniref:L-lactate dehydrogenase (cytochrome) n=1 Tax=Puccinia sorghi TaxID=27349 RepID=A0A0L6VB09_9BASI|nr:L-lactate dehydrogenase (Cytochrome) [Puccinia sorghi]
MGKLTAAEIRKHASAKNCWVVIHGEAYDITHFLPEHPGGQAIILKYAGADATDAYDPIHPPGTIQEYLAKEHHKGQVEETELQLLRIQQHSSSKQKDAHTAELLPPLSSYLSLSEFEDVAQGRLTKQAWAYYSSGSDDEMSMRENSAAFQRVWFRPRVLRDVSRIDYSSRLLNSSTSIPIYITATALGKLGHPDGEKNLTWAAGKEDVIQMIPTLASCAFEELVEARVPGQTQWYQVYVNQDRAKTALLIQRAERAGITALFITVDAPQLGRRPRDMRLKFEDLGSDLQVQDGVKVDRSQGATRAISSFIDASLSWADIPWLKSITKLPILLKGIQCWEDAVMAREQGLAGIVLSNHGGRQLDYARSGLEVLVEVVAALKARGMYSREEFAIFIDGGVRRAGEVLKALCLGASGVGIGRPFLYAYSLYGYPGVVRALQILKEEMEMNMRLIGAPTLAHLSPDMVDCSSLNSRRIDAPGLQPSCSSHLLPHLKAAKL